MGKRVKTLVRIANERLGKKESRNGTRLEFREYRDGCALYLAGSEFAPSLMLAEIYPDELARLLGVDDD